MKYVLPCGRISWQRCWSFRDPARDLCGGVCGSSVSASGKVVLSPFRHSTFSTFSVRAGNRCAHNDKAISLLHLRYNLPVSLRQVARVRVVAPAAATWPYSADW